MTEDLVKIKMLSDKAMHPHRASLTAAGYDLFAAHDVVIQPGAREIVYTDISMEIPPGMYGRIAGRSGFAYLMGVNVFQGVIDSDFRGNIGILISNNGDVPFEVNIHTRVGQIIFERIANPIFQITKELEATQRGSSGFGSTGQ